MTFPPRLARAALLIFSVGCGSKGTTQPGVGEFTAEWLGSDTGGITARPHGIWCQTAERLEVTVMKEDAGIGVAIYPSGPLEPGRFPIFDPGVDTTQRPGIAIAARWFDKKTVTAYQSDSGALSLNREPSGGWSGRFGARLRSLNGADTIRMSGHFGEVLPLGCPADSAAARPPAD